MDVKKYLQLLQPSFRFLLPTGIIFLSALFFGIYTALTNTEATTEALDELGQFASFFMNLSSWQLMLVIMVNNVLKSFVALIGGLLFGIPPFMYLLINGNILGLLSAHLVATGTPLTEVLILLVPHGIIELAGFLLASSYGFFLGFRMYRRIQYKDLLRPHVHQALRAFVYIIAPLLIVASLVEAFITPHLLPLVV